MQEPAAVLVKSVGLSFLYHQHDGVHHNSSEPYTLCDLTTLANNVRWFASVVGSHEVYGFR